MNCKPGDLARIIPHLMTTNLGIVDVVVRVTAINAMSSAANGEPVWDYEGNVNTVFGRIESLEDALLRPIRDPGEDARDETLSWLPVPTKEREHA